MARINTYPKLSTVDPSDLLVVTDVTSSENPTRNITIGQLTQYIQTAQNTQYHVFNGLVNNLGSQGSGGTVADNLKAEIANYIPNTTIFEITSADSGTFVFGQADVSSFNIDLVQNDNIAVIGEETGTITPNAGELAISLKFKVI